ncbi:MAG: dihydroorotase [Actinomycetaceae bacterium]|nr:dihydroorotase [Arcanobacterium sp.]MDD7686811.1 dihydroorotase [Actinomycetaceae bacterium]MDY5273606.1 dihydroorotase [Arcanobacterium sp.]
MGTISGLRVVKPEKYSHFSPQLEIIERMLSQAGCDFSSLTVFPGFCDVHVHLREPGFSYKETIATGTRAAAHGGFTDVCAMPNLDPVPDSLAHLAYEQELIERDAVINVYPYASITRGEAGAQLADIAQLGQHVVGFSDDGKGVQSSAMMREAMELIAATGKPIATHSEIEELKGDGYINDGDYAHAHGHRGIPKEAEWRQIQRDIELAKVTGVKYHVCHISCAESVQLVRAAKARGIDMTCETAPHYVLIDDSMLEEDGRFKMNPPLRSPADRQALVEALVDGTIDMIATDHAPHGASEKAQGLAGSAFGIVGIETSFQLMYTHFVASGKMSMERLLELMVVNPRERFGLPMPGSDDFTVWDLSARSQIDPENFLSRGHAQPFTGMEVNGRCLMTVAGGTVAYTAPELAVNVTGSEER